MLDEDAPPPHVIELHSSRKRPNRPIKPKALKKLRKEVAIDDEDTDEIDDIVITSPTCPRQNPVRSAKKQPAQVDCIVPAQRNDDQSLISAIAPPAAAAAAQLLQSTPLVPALPSAPSCQPISSMTTLPILMHNEMPTSMDMFESMKQQELHCKNASVASSSAATMMMLSGLLYENMTIKLRAEELERREKIRQESDSKAQFQAMFLAFMNSQTR